MAQTGQDLPQAAFGLDVLEPAACMAWWQAITIDGISPEFAGWSCRRGICAWLGRTKPVAITRATKIVIISRGQDLFAKQCSRPGNAHSAPLEMDRVKAIARAAIP